MARRQRRSTKGTLPAMRWAAGGLMAVVAALLFVAVGLQTPQAGADETETSTGGVIMSLPEGVVLEEVDDGLDAEADLTDEELQQRLEMAEAEGVEAERLAEEESAARAALAQAAAEAEPVQEETDVQAKDGTGAQEDADDQNKGDKQDTAQDSAAADAAEAAGSGAGFPKSKKLTLGDPGESGVAGDAEAGNGLAEETVNPADAAAAGAVIVGEQDNTEVQHATKSSYAVLMNDGYIYPADSRGKRIDQAFESNTTSSVTHLFIDPNTSSISDVTRYYYGTRGYSSSNHRLQSFYNLQEVTFMLRNGSRVVTTIDGGAFRNLKYLRKLNNFKQSNVTKIGSSTFRSCRSLQAVSLPTACIEIWDDTFRDCSSLEKIDWNGTKKNRSLGFRVFQDCVSLTSVTINGVLHSWVNTFDGCRSLKTFVVDLLEDSSSDTIHPEISRVSKPMYDFKNTPMVAPGGGQANGAWIYVHAQDYDSILRRLGTSDNRYYHIRVLDPENMPKASAGSQKQGKVTRLAGQNAYGTTGAVVKAGWTKSKTVIIATINGYWDALAASSIAGGYDAPILLTDTNKLTEATRKEIKRLGANHAIIVGGPAAVSKNCEKQVKNALVGGKFVDRYGGANAIGTANKIAAALGNAHSDTCIIATSNGYWDALAASPYAYAKHSPIFLTNPNGKLSNATIDAIRKGGYKTAIIVGGTAVVNSRTQNTLWSGTKVNYVYRKAGTNAYQTAGTFAQWAIGQGMTANNMGVATANGYWDALTGGALCGKRNAVLVLADQGHTEAFSIMRANSSQIKQAYVFGGNKAVSNAVMKAAAQAAR